MKPLFIALLNYKKPLDEINEIREEHLKFIGKYTSLGKLLTAGRQNPPAGGTILAYNVTREELTEILQNDPYYLKGFVEHSIIEFTPGLYSEEFKNMIETLEGKER